MPIDSSASYIPLDGSSRSGCWGQRSSLERSLIFVIAFLAVIVITLSIAFAYKKCEDSNVTTVAPTSSSTAPTGPPTKPGNHTTVKPVPTTPKPTVPPPKPSTDGTTVTTPKHKNTTHELHFTTSRPIELGSIPTNVKTNKTNAAAQQQTSTNSTENGTLHSQANGSSKAAANLN